MPHSLFLPISFNATSQIRVFCFPYAGAGPSIFTKWQNLLDPKIELMSLNLPGRGVRFAEEPYADMRNLIDAAFVDIATKLDKPFIFWGYSLGAKIAYELLCKLFHNNMPLPYHFIVVASPAPHITRTIKSISHLNDDDFLEEIEKYSGTPVEILQHRELMDLLLPALKGDFSILDNYQPAEKKSWKIPISILGGKSDHLVSVDDLKKWEELFHNIDSFHLFDGDHFFINSHQNELIQVINNIAKNISN